MKVVITGGHITPAISVIDEFEDKDIVFFYGRKFQFKNEKRPSFEYKTITKRKIPFRVVDTGRFYRYLSYKSIREVLKIPIAIIQAYHQLKKDNPDIILTFGGYISIPVGIAGWLQKVPIVVHEQTFEAGLANRTLALFAKKICVSHESSIKFFPSSKTVLTGNPIRGDVLKPDRKLFLPKGKIIYFTGGSTGSQEINKLVRASLEALLTKYIVIHQTGDSSITNDYKHSVEKRNKLPPNSREKYIIKKHVPSEEIGWILHNSSVVVSRAGINIVQELLHLKKNAILIPFEGGQKNEQARNATWYKKSGLGEIISQSKLSPEKLIDTISKVQDKKMKKNFSFEEDGAKKVYNIVKEIHEKSKKKI